MVTAAEAGGGGTFLPPTETAQGRHHRRNRRRVPLAHNEKAQRELSKQEKKERKGESGMTQLLIFMARLEQAVLLASLLINY